MHKQKTLPIHYCESGQPPCEIPLFENIKPEHYVPAYKFVMEEHNKEIQVLINYNMTREYCFDRFESKDAVGREFSDNKLN